MLIEDKFIGNETILAAQLNSIDISSFMNHLCGKFSTNSSLEYKKINCKNTRVGFLGGFFGGSFGGFFGGGGGQGLFSGGGGPPLSPPPQGAQLYFLRT